MIKFDLQPVCWRVAIGADRAHGVVVNVVLLVTGITVCRRIANPLFCNMAVGTDDFSVLSQQLEISKCMVERFLIQLDDVGVPSFMIGMAIGAGVFPGVFEQTMEADSSLDIDGDLFMAVEAQGALIATVESLVAGGTLRFEFRMALDHLPWHDERFNAGSIAGLAT
jgi:hypothetical protein